MNHDEDTPPLSHTSTEILRRTWRDWAVVVLALAVVLLAVLIYVFSQYAYETGRADEQHAAATKNADAAKDLAAKISRECKAGSPEGEVYRQTGLCREARKTVQKVSAPPQLNPSAQQASCQGGDLVIVLSDQSTQTVTNARVCEGPATVSGPTVVLPGPTQTATSVVTQVSETPGPTATATVTTPGETETVTVPGPTSTATQTVTVTAPPVETTTTTTVTATTTATATKTVTVPPGHGKGKKR